VIVGVYNIFYNIDSFCSGEEVKVMEELNDELMDKMVSIISDGLIEWDLEGGHTGTHALVIAERIEALLRGDKDPYPNA